MPIIILFSFYENCHIHICSVCVESDNHIGHKLRNILRRTAELDLKRLENSILPRFEHSASELKTRKANLKSDYEKRQIMSLNMVNSGTNKSTTLSKT